MKVVDVEIRQMRTDMECQEWSDGAVRHLRPLWKDVVFAGTDDEGEIVEVRFGRIALEVDPLGLMTLGGKYVITIEQVAGG